MSSWTERLKNHEVFGALSSLGSAIADAEKRDGVGPTEFEQLSRLRTVITFVGKRLDSADGELVAFDVLGQLAGVVAQASRSVRQFAEGAESTALTEAQVHADEVVAQFGRLIFPVSQDDLSGLRDAAQRYREAVTSHLQNVHSRVGGTLSRMAELERMQDELKAQLTDVTQKSAVVLEEQRTQFAAEREARESRFDSVFTAQQDHFSSAQETRNQVHSEAQNARQLRFDEAISEYGKQLSDRKAEFDKSAEKLSLEHTALVTDLRQRHEAEANAVLERIEAHKAQVERLVGVIGNLGVTSGHKVAAKHAQRAVWFWQAIALLAMGYLVYVATQHFLPSSMASATIAQGDVTVGPAAGQSAAPPVRPFSWPEFALRVYISLTIGAIAAYAGSQADRYQKTERKQRQLALELEAIGPFIEPLPVELQQQFRLAIGERSFGRDDSGLSDRSPTSVVEALNSGAGKEILQGLLKKVSDVGRTE
jgi:hypothetical protein